MNKKFIIILCSALVLLSTVLPFALPIGTAAEAEGEEVAGTAAEETEKEDAPETSETPETPQAPAPIEFSKLYIIDSKDTLDAFKALVEGGESFKGKTVLLCTSLSAESFAINGTFSGTFNALGNTLTLKSLTVPLFKELDGAKIENLTLTVAEGENLSFEGSSGALLADSTKDSDFALCKVIAKGITLTFTPLPEGGETTPEGGETNPEGSETTPEGSETNPEGSETTPEGSETNPEDGENSPEPQTEEGTEGIFALYALTAQGCKFTNCLASADFGVMTHSADASQFKNILLSGVDALFDSSADSSYKNIVSSKPLDLIEDEHIINDGSDLDALAALLNADSESDPELVKWETGDGTLTLHFHSFTAETTPKSCVAYEKTTYICQSCLHVSIVTVHPEKGQAEHEKSDVFTVTQPTCTEKGYTKYECNVCKAVFKADEVKETGHKTTTVGKLSATCVDKGYTGDKVCKTCNETVSTGKATKPTGVHTWRNPVVTLEPTPDSEGEVTYYCLYCTATNVEKISSTGHEQLEEFKYCDENYHDALCSCGERHFKEAHDYKKIGTIKQPTADEKGIVLYRCTVCLHEKELAEIDALGHTLGAWTDHDDENHSATCSCGEVKLEAHKLDKGVLVSDGITDKTGIKKVLYSCKVCTYQTVEEIPVSIPEDPSQIAREQSIKKYSKAIAALLIIGGVLALGYTKFTDRK